MKTDRRSLNAEKELKKAARLFRLHKFNEVLRDLEPQTFRFRENHFFYYLLGTACLYMGDAGGAFTYLRRAMQLNDSDINTLLGMAAVHLKRGESNEAIMYLLNVLDIDPNNRKAKKALKQIRDTVSNETLYDFIESDDVMTVYPSTGFAVPRWLIAVVAVIAIAPMVLLLVQNLNLLPFSAPPRSEEIEKLTIQSSQDLVATSGEHTIILSEKEVLEAFNKAKKHFNKYEDNLARLEINRILNSNAAEIVKEKARFLMSYLRTPTFSNLKHSFSYEQVRKKPYLYEGCYVIWKGRISNLTVTEKEITFDFLVGYHDQKVLEGIVPVLLDFAVELEQGYPIELLGRLDIDDIISLNGVSVHKLAP